MSRCNCGDRDCLDCWADCAVAYCEWKSCRALNSPFCYRHTTQQVCRCVVKQVCREIRTPTHTEMQVSTGIHGS